MIGFVRSADPQYSSAVINTNVIVSHTGEVVWLSHGIFRSSCDIDVEFFPFDEQRCVLKWASWTYDGYQVRSIFPSFVLTWKSPYLSTKWSSSKVKDGGNVRGSCRKFRAENRIGQWEFRDREIQPIESRMQFSTQLTRTITSRRACEMLKSTRNQRVRFPCILFESIFKLLRCSPSDIFLFSFSTREWNTLLDTFIIYIYLFLSLLYGILSS